MLVGVAHCQRRDGAALRGPVERVTQVSDNDPRPAPRPVPGVPDDLAVSKLVAHRDKERALVAASCARGSSTLTAAGSESPCSRGSHAPEATLIETWLGGQVATGTSDRSTSQRRENPSVQRRTTPGSTAGSFAPRRHGEAPGVDVTEGLTGRRPVADPWVLSSAAWGPGRSRRASSQVRGVPTTTPGASEVDLEKFAQDAFESRPFS